MKKRYVFYLLLSTLLIVIIGKEYQKSQFDQMNEKFYVAKISDSIKIRNKYNDIQDIEIEWALGGANNLFDYQRTLFLKNKEEFVSDSGTGEQYHTADTDFFGPHRVLALNNVDGDIKHNTTDFTGGNHAYDGGVTGSPTARTENLQLFVDGDRVDNYSGYADKITITWENYVQASNTKKVDGSGREVLKENYSLIFNGEHYTVSNKIEFLEDVNMETYYGLQFAYHDSWNDTITYNGFEETTYSVLEDSTSESLNVESILLQDDNHLVEFGINSDIGLGKRSFVNNSDFGAFNVSNTNKAYFWLIDGVEMTEGDTVLFEGYYQFSSK